MRAGINWQDCGNPRFNAWRIADGIPPASDGGLNGYLCGTLHRPLVRSKPTGAQVSLPVIMHPATGDPASVIGTLCWNPGGPGESGLSRFRTWYLLGKDVQERFNFVTWDPRGIGAATPAIQGKGCNIPKPSRPATGSVNWQKVLAARVTQVRTANRACFAANANLIQHAGTVEGAYDLDALRQAMGEQQINYWGLSYGTLLGSTYAQIFPKNVRTMIFDANMDPQGTLAGINAGSVAPDNAIRFFLQANPDLAPQYSAVRKALNSRTLRLPNGTRYTRWDLLDVLNDSVSFYVNPGSDWSTARQVIATAYTAISGPPGTLQRSAALMTLQTNASLKSPSTGTVGSLWSAVVCQDFADRISPTQQQTMMAWNVQHGPIYGGSLGVDYLTTCNGYGKATPHQVPTPVTYGPSIQGLVLNSTRDGETPYQWGVNMARTYPTTTLLTVVNGIHGTYVLGESFTCVNTAVAAVLISGKSPAQDAACPFSPPIPLP